MLPISEIKIGDIFKRQRPYELLWLVEEVILKEKMIKISTEVNGKYTSVWKKNTDKLFSDQNRLF
jgi:hypothetical protein